MAEYYSPNEFDPWSKAAIEQMISTRGGYDPNLMQYGLNDSQLSYWQNVLNQMNQGGSGYSFETLGQSAPTKSGGSFGDLVADFVTSPAFLTLAGGVGGVYAAPAAAAGAGAAEGAAAGGAAASGTGGALGSGITATAAEGGLGAGLGTTTTGTGLSAGTLGLGGGSGTAAGLGGASGTGLTTAGALGTGSSLAPGYFASEGLAAGGGSAAGAPATGGESSLLPQGTSLTDLAMKAAPAALGMYASGKQSDAYSGLAGQYMAMGEPYRQRLSDLYNDPSSFLNSPEVQVPVQQGTNILARSLSTQGNPVGSGNALQELQNYATNQMYSRLGQERDRLGGFGGLTQYQAAAPGLASQGIGAQRGFYDAIGAGMADIFGNNQRKIKLEDLISY